MICTVKEARERWCPMVRFIAIPEELAGGLASGYETVKVSNRSGYGLDSKCIAAECMWWKWDGDLMGYCGKVGR